MKIVTSILLGLLFGTALVQSGAFHWYRIQEMFHFESFHMFGLIFSAIATGVVSVQLIKLLKLKSVYGNKPTMTKKSANKYSNALGGVIFGAGWALTGACTAPLFILLGFEWRVGLIALSGAVLGTLLYGKIKDRLPH